MHKLVDASSERQSLCQTGLPFTKAILATPRSSPKPRPHCRSAKLKVMKLGRGMSPCGEGMLRGTSLIFIQICFTHQAVLSALPHLHQERNALGRGSRATGLCRVQARRWGKTALLPRHPLCPGWLFQPLRRRALPADLHLPEELREARSSSDADPQKTPIYTH